MKIEEMGLLQFEYQQHCEQSTSERQQSRKRRYLLMAGIFGAVFIISAIITAVIALNYHEENTCGSGLKCMHIKECEELNLSYFTFPCSRSKICCIPKLSIRVELNEKNRTERLRKQNILTKNDCGVLPLQDKLADGEDAVLGSFPWMAVLGYSAPVNLGQSIVEFKCGGTLISDQYILTAAHCIEKSLTSVYLGTVNLTSVRYNTTECYIYEDGSKTCVYPLKFSIENIIVHPEYNNKNLKNDIALIKLKGKVDKDEEFVKTICLPFNLNVDERLGWKNFTFSMTGWGLVENHGSIHNILQHVKKVEPWKYDRCTDNLVQSVDLLPLTRKQICGTGQNFSEACKGDSGGPLAYTYHVTTQIGIISFKPLHTCGSIKQPTIFTRVDGYLDWILDNIDI